VQNFNVRTRAGNKSKGILTAGNRNLPCALGRSGIGIKRVEGDGVTPRGEFLLLELLLRRDRISLRASNFDWHSILPNDGWCDAQGDRNYNRPVKLPYPASHERLFRDDHLYDIVLVMDYNYSQNMGVGGSAAVRFSFILPMMIIGRLRGVWQFPGSICCGFYPVLGQEQLSKFTNSAVSPRRLRKQTAG